MEFKPLALYELLHEDLSHTTLSGTHLRASETLEKTLLKKSSYGRSAICGERAILAFKQRAYLDSPDIPDVPFARWALANWLRPFPGTITLFTEENILDGMRTGPGSALHAFERSTCGMLKLFHGNISCSSQELYREYVGLIGKHDPLWFSSELHRAEIYGPPRFTGSNRVTTVPKDNTIDRVIAVEPVINSVMQQGVRHVLEHCLARIGVSLETTPDVNRRLARLGSMGYGLATVDFSAASDSISRRLIEALLPSDVGDYILFVSSPAFQVGSECIKAERIALSMGNAVTFPLQTLIFLALCYEVFRRRGRQFIIGENVSVFGDDIVMPDDLAEDFCNLSIQCGFSPNKEKSYWTGEFRESCGTDWFNGVNVRGVYLKEHRGLGAVFTARNLLYSWSHRWQIPLSRSVGYLDQILKDSSSFWCVPLHAPINSGVRTDSVPVGAYSRKRQAFSFQQWTPVNRYRKGDRYFTINPYGAIAGALFGFTRDGQILERRRGKVQYRTRKSYSSWGWDFPNPDESWMYDTARTSGGSFRSFELD